MKSSSERKGLNNNSSKDNQSVPHKNKQDKNPYLPEKLHTNLEQSFGFDFSKVQILRNSKKAEELKARAYTQGEQIRFAPGEFNPNTESGRNLIGHEFTHIVQQRSGLVQPTSILGKGLAVNNDPILEREADQLGAQAVKGMPIQKYQSASLGIRNSLRTLQAKSNVIQRAHKTIGGSWDTNRYDLRKDKDARGNVHVGARGVDIVIKFTPEPPTDAELIGLTQTARTIENKKPIYKYNKTIQDRSIGAGDPNEGTQIDRVRTRNNPIYGGQSLGAGQSLADTRESSNTTANPTVVDNVHDASTGGNSHHQLGWRFKSGKNWKTQDAMLFDGPTAFQGARNSKQVFETTALALKGNQTGTYYGSVQWGWETDATGNHTKIPFKVINHGAPSDVFMQTAKVWNASKDSTGADSVDLPTFDAVPIYQGPYDDILDIQPYLRLPENTPVRILNSDGLTAYIEVTSGAYTGERGYVTALGGVPFTNVVP